jgi:arylsulfatase A
LTPSRSTNSTSSSIPCNCAGTRWSSKSWGSWTRRGSRDGQWKLHFPHDYRTLDGKAGGTGRKPAPYAQGKTELALYDLDNDIGETRNVAAQNPDVVKRLQALADKAREDLGDSATKREGKGVRPPGKE